MNWAQLNRIWGRLTLLVGTDAHWIVYDSCSIVFIKNNIQDKTIRKSNYCTNGYLNQSETSQIYRLCMETITPVITMITWTCRTACTLFSFRYTGRYFSLALLQILVHVILPELDTHQLSLIPKRGFKYLQEFYYIGYIRIIFWRYFLFNNGIY